MSSDMRSVSDLKINLPLFFHHLTAAVSWVGGLSGYFLMASDNVRMWNDLDQPTVDATKRNSL